MVEVEIGEQIDRIDCQTGEQLAFHIHGPSRSESSSTSGGQPPNRRQVGHAHKKTGDLSVRRAGFWCLEICNRGGSAPA
jgi:hypothetical protein